MPTIASPILSRDLARRVHATRSNCYWNAHAIVRRVGLASLREATYVEGFCLDRAVPFFFEHGWVELADGTIIEPTLSIARDYDPAAYEYFPAHRLYREALPVRMGQPLHLALPLYRTTAWQRAARAAMDALKVIQARAEISPEEATPEEALERLARHDLEGVEQ